MIVFGEEHEVGDVLATADFHLTGTGYKGVPIDEKVHAELSVSGAFEYGNRTCMSFEWENGNVDGYDTRYNKVSPKTFKEFAREVLDNRTMDTVKVEII